MLLAKEPKFIEFILSAKKILRGPRFLKYPGYYPEYLRQVFQVSAFEKEARLGLILAKQDVSNIVKQSKVWTQTPFIRERNLAFNSPVRSSTVAVDPELPAGEEERPGNCQPHSEICEKQPQFQKVKPRRKRTSQKSFVAKNYENNNSQGNIDISKKSNRIIIIIIYFQLSTKYYRHRYLSGHLVLIYISF